MNHPVHICEKPTASWTPYAQEPPKKTSGHCGEAKKESTFSFRRQLKQTFPEEQQVPHCGEVRKGAENSWPDGGGR